MNYYFDIGERIRKRRIELGMKQEDVCQKLQEIGINFYRQKLAKLENGQEVPVTVPQIRALASVLKCDIGYLMGEIQEKTYAVHEACKLLGLTEKAITNMISCKETPSNPVLCRFLESEQLYSVIIPIILKCVNAFVEDRETTLRLAKVILSLDEEGLEMTGEMLGDMAKNEHDRRVDINSSLPDIVKDKTLSNRYILDGQENIYQRFLYSLSIADAELYRGIIDSILVPITAEMENTIKQSFIDRGFDNMGAEKELEFWTARWKK